MIASSILDLRGTGLFIVEIYPLCVWRPCTHTHAVTYSSDFYQEASLALSSSSSCSQLGAISSCSHQRSSSTLVKVLLQNRGEETSKDCVVLFFSPRLSFWRVKLQRCENDNTELKEPDALRVCTWVETLKNKPGGIANALCVFACTVSVCKYVRDMYTHTHTH